jgi:RNA polymerase sigma-70 factor (ECF subfamily)
MSNSSAFSSDLLAALPNLRAFAYSLSGSPDRADDLVQETMVKAWSKQSSFTPGTNLRAWLFTILRNTYYSELRKQRHEIQDTDGALAARLASPPEQDGRLDLADFQVAFRTLNDDQREAIVLVAAEGFSYEEAAEICHCAVGTLKSRVNRARARLAELLGVESPADLGPDANYAAIVARATATSRGI